MTSGSHVGCRGRPPTIGSAPRYDTKGNPKPWNTPRLGANSTLRAENGALVCDQPSVPHESSNQQNAHQQGHYRGLLSTLKELYLPRIALQLCCNSRGAQQKRAETTEATNCSGSHVIRPPATSKIPFAAAQKRKTSVESLQNLRDWKSCRM